MRNLRRGRTLQRWLSKARRHALDIQQAIRHELIEKCEPRPVERLFPRGLSPPKSLRRRFGSPDDLDTLWRAFAMLLAGAAGLDFHVSHLLAGARRRWHRPADDTFPI